ncbi:hypothetical protein KVR01_001853 [Diaporthe batatas]|uniref:uncharacterized protein n=1 Tax=Diaporthe batatas TaxID=748121 RepID=UPI001D05592B|nr:uncharacterized protein KVR01_001853 [Diaporthe batatas]KAG8169104.1 hypothetical protein KVR01_001853 [Diaporthe batatas]
MTRADSKRLLRKVSESPPKAWVVIDQELSDLHKDRNSNHIFWWNSTGIPFAILLEKAGYQFEKQLQHLRFYFAVIVPELGDGTRHDGTLMHWKSFMTDHHSPVEFSWAWNRETELPVVRFSFEPIGQAAGTPLDPNNQYAALRLVANQHSQINGCDLLWFNHLWENLVQFDTIQNLCPSNNGMFPEGTESEPSHKSRAFLALELNKDCPMLKAYYMPVFKAAATGRTTMSVINDGITSLPYLPQGVLNGHRKLLKFLGSNSQGRSLAPEIVATDCIAPERSRVKIYMRSQTTSLESVIETLCLGDSAVLQNQTVAVNKFIRLWNLVFGLPNGWDAQAQLPKVSHRTGGMLYYFSLGGGRTGLTVKVYLPVRHYAKGDKEAAASLKDYLRTESRADFGDNYTQAMDEIMWVHEFIQNIAK